MDLLKPLADKIGLVITGALILSLAAFYNGYPLVYWDTGTYIYSGFSRFVPVDRPVAYGIFLRYFSFSRSLWYVITVQNLILSGLLLSVFSLFFSGRRLSLFFVTSVFILSCLTGISWYSSQVMPDIFTAILALSIFLLYYGKSGALRKIVLSALVVAGSITHFSNLLIAPLILIVLFTCDLISFRRSRTPLPQGLLKRVSLMMLLTLSPWLVLPAINYGFEKKFFVSKGSHVFLIGHFTDNGVLGKFLKENCNRPEFRDNDLCRYRDSLPSDLSAFLWAENSVLKKSGGWEESRPGYNKVIREIISSPKYFIFNLRMTLIYGFIQMTRNEIGSGLTIYREGSQPHGQIHWRFNDELHPYMNARQNNGEALKPTFAYLNKLNLLLNIGSLLILIAVYFSVMRKSLNPVSAKFVSFTLITLFVNAIVTAGLNAPSERFQARVSWMLPACVLILLFANSGVLFSRPGRIIRGTQSSEELRDDN